MTLFLILNYCSLKEKNSEDFPDMKVVPTNGMDTVVVEASDSKVDTITRLDHHRDNFVGLRRNSFFGLYWNIEPTRIRWSAHLFVVDQGRGKAWTAVSE